MNMEQTVSSETSAIRTQTPGNYSKRNKLHLEHGESLKTIDIDGHNVFLSIAVIYYKHYFLQGCCGSALLREFPEAVVWTYPECHPANMEGNI